MHVGFLGFDIWLLVPRVVFISVDDQDEGIKAISLFMCLFFMFSVSEKQFKLS